MTINRSKIIQYLRGNNDEELFNLSSEVKSKHVGNNVYLRGLIEQSNICSKNCLYCGIRKDNSKVIRYTMTDEEVLAAAEYAYKQNFGSVVLQSGEIEAKYHTKKITSLIEKIMQLSDRKLGITLSLGEQDEDVLRRWKEAGAIRYLLRIEASDQHLYEKIHPNNDKHNFNKRCKTIDTLKNIGYQVGTGVMIGLPFQTTENLAHDLLFFQKTDIDMCGMGPYIEHSETPLYQYKDNLLSLKERFKLALRMIALLRIMMPDINIAATTAMHTIEPDGRERAIKAGANIIMPNINPAEYRDKYLLYEDKPWETLGKEDVVQLSKNLKTFGEKIVYNEQGNSKHFKKIS